MKQEGNAKPTTFIDPVSKKYVIASLENTILDKLRDNFGEDNVVEKDDGSIRLTGKAEAFVSGWFADIAYQRDFLIADANSDGKLTEDEYDNTKNNFGIEGLVIMEDEDSFLLSTEKVTQSYTQALDDDYRNYREFDIATSLDDELNTTLQGDVDYDGKMTLKEAYNTNGNDSNSVIMKHLKEFDFPTKPSDSDTSNFDFMLDFILDVFAKKDGKEQEDIIDDLMMTLNELDTNNADEMKEFETLYSQDYFDQLLNLKDPKDKKVEKYI